MQLRLMGLQGLIMSVVEEYQNKLSDMLDESTTVKIVGNGMQGQAEKRVTSGAH